MHTKGKRGFITKTVQIRSNDPEHPVKVLKLKARVLDPYHQNIESPRAIFSSPCRSCHVDRGIGKTGGVLYRADCIICHRRGKKAGSLSDMKKLSKKELEKIISYGRDGTMMPGFSSMAGGPLTEDQVSSLVRYIKGR